MKHLKLDDESGEIEARARFELSQCVLDDADQFLFDVIPAGMANRYLGLIWRKDNGDRLLNQFGEETGERLADSGFQLRAAALADGYIKFCRPAGGDFVCLVDFAERAVSMAFVHKSGIADLACLPAMQAGLDSPRELEKAAVEIKTLAAYRINSLFADGVTTPLSSLLVSGQGCGDEVLAALGKYFSVEIARPRLNTGFISAETNHSDNPVEQYLVALGLTAN